MNVTDLNPVIHQWAQGQSSRYNNGRETTRMEVDWSRIKFKTNKTSFPTQTSHNRIRPHPRAQLSVQPQSQIVFKSNYKNNTGEVQQHTFCMERTTEATVRTELTQGFSRNGAVGINIDVPDNVSNMTGSFGNDVAIETEDVNIVKHTVSWSINSTVRAPPGKTTVAEMRINEKQHECQFEADVIIRGQVMVKVIDSTSGNVIRVIENDIKTILSDQMTKRLFNPPEGMVGFDGRKVTWKVAGNLTFRFGVSQDVKVWHE